MKFDLEFVPFSRFGSYLSFSTFSDEAAKRNNRPGGLWLRCLHGDAAREVFHVEVLANGNPVPCRIVTAPSHLTLKTKVGDLKICIAENEVVLFRGHGVGLRLTNYASGFAMPAGDGRWYVNVPSTFRYYMLAPLAGRLSVDPARMIGLHRRVVADFAPNQDGGMECAIEQYVAQWSKRTYPDSFDSCVATVAQEFERFRKAHLPVPSEMAAAADLATYINWASVVHPCGNFKRYAMLMSKNRMCNLWSWDHCFNAMACSYGLPELAWDQLMVVFDQQHPSGQLPDYINDAQKLMNFVKPPIHGWALGKMLKNNRWFAADKSRLKDIYNKLSKHTDWWFTCRDADGDGLPAYHHGFDSGWDNCTAFDIGFPIKGPDLAAFLIVQMDTLADLARQLGKPADTARWIARANATQEAMMRTLWNGDRFTYSRSGSMAVAEKSDSLIGCLPIILGQRLPAAVRKKLTNNIRRHLTKWGPATEHPRSKLYEPDGYWRGPVWAPSTMILVDGLSRAGETVLAKDIAQRFCNLAKKCGFAENFDAITGKPLRDRAYTWTSSVFLIMAIEYGGHRNLIQTNKVGNKSCRQ